VVQGGGKMGAVPVAGCIGSRWRSSHLFFCVLAQQFVDLVPFRLLLRQSSPTEN
jgi:hypothetical protein